MNIEARKVKETRRLLMDKLDVPVKLRGSFIRYCRHGTGDIYDRECYFWDEDKLKWGQYAPVEDRSRVYHTMGEMWIKYKSKHTQS